MTFHWVPRIRGPVRPGRRVLSSATAATLLIGVVAVGVTVSAPSALAAGTVLFNQPFHDNTVDGPAGSVAVPAAATGTNWACLSAAGNATKNPLASCATSTDVQGSGKLRWSRSPYPPPRSPAPTPEPSPTPSPDRRAARVSLGITAKVSAPSDGMPVSHAT